MFDFKDLIDYCHAEALASTIEPTLDSLWRQICRYYSMKFSTPLHQVLQMDAFHVITNVYEQQMSEDVRPMEDRIEKYLDMIYTLEDPDYADKQSEELKEFIEEAIEEEAERVRAGRPIHKALKNESSLGGPATPKTTMPASGGIDLSYLEREELGD